MNIRRPSLLGLAIALALAAAAQAAEGPSSYDLASGKVTVAGTSNLHEWTVSADALHGSAAVAGGFLEGRDGGNATGTFSLASRALRSDKDRMNTLMWSALKADQQPTLSFALRGGSAKPGGAAGTVTLQAQGVLTIAGVAHEVTIPATVRVDGNRLLVHGELPISMTDYGIKPPTALLGTLRTGDRVTITIEATLVPHA